jgi:N-acetyl-anhydromuramyl-L-alanine amidase AmpD
MIDIKDSLGHKDGKQLAFKRSPNVGGALKPTAIILHDTASPLNADGPISWLTNPAAKVSAHVVIARDGTITQLVPFNKVAWHAGVSKWNGKSGCNSFTIGIEIVNPGTLSRVSEGVYSGVKTFHDGDVGVTPIARAKDQYHGDAYWMTYTDEQVQAVIDLCRGLVASTPSIKEIITHYLVSPGRKVDVNPLFPLQAVRDAVFGQKESVTVSPKAATAAAIKVVPDATTTASALNLRTGPGTNFEAIASLPKGTRVDVQPSGTDGWYKVAVEKSGKTGFVSSAFVKLD